MKIPYCQKHNQSAIDNFLYSRTDEGYRCKLCRSEIMRANYLKNREKILARTSDWRKNNPERVKIYKTIEYQMQRLSILKEKVRDDSRVKQLQYLLFRIAEIRRFYEKYRRAS